MHDNMKEVEFDAVYVNDVMLCLSEYDYNVYDQ